MVKRALERRAREAEAWLMEACFPLWAEAGLDGNLFREALELSHRPLDAQEVRVRVQARQAYVFSVATEMGWDPQRAAELIMLGQSALNTVCRRPDGLFGRRIDIAAGVLSDDTADLYDTAFALHASAHMPVSDLRAGLIDETLKAVDAQLSDPHGGYAESLPRPEYRLQNPHMHFLEACLALHQMDPTGGYLKRAKAIHTLCLNHFIDDATGTLGERFLPDNWASPDGEAGAVVEPGHQFEWVWLLAEYARLSREDLPEQVRRLYSFACSTLDSEGRAIQSCLRNGTPVDASRRTWPQTEALKAHLMMWRLGDPKAGVRAETSFDILMDEYLTPEGGWIDHYSADGNIVATNMPASTGYHVVLAFYDMIHALKA